MVRGGHRGFLTGVLPDVDECLNNYEAEKKVELAKWHTALKEQLDKILPLDKEIYAELIADEKSIEEDIMAEIELQDSRLTYFKHLQLSTKN